jgi:hypothetical protein
MWQRLQAQLQSEVTKVLPGFVVSCECTSAHVIDICIRNHATHESIRITGVTLESLLGPRALNAMVEQLMFEIVAIAPRAG